VDKKNMRFVQSKGSPWNAFPIESTHIDVSDYDYDESFSFSMVLLFWFSYSIDRSKSF
jgi:hypothetical protein